MKTIFVIVVLSAISLANTAEPIFLSHRLSNLFSALPDSARQRLISTDSASVYFNATMHLVIYWKKCNSDLVQHLGIKIFDLNQSRQLPQEVIYCIERLLLECILCKDTSQFKKIISSERIQCSIDNILITDRQHEMFISLPEILSNVTNVSISNDAHNFAFTINNRAGRTLSLKLPVNYSVIMGMDKAELDRYLYNKIMTSKDSTFRSDSISGPILTQVKELVFLKKGKDYQNNISSDIFYYRKNKKFEMICDSAKFAESLRNLCLNPTAFGKMVSLNISQYAYGNTVKKYTVNLNSFLNVFQDGFERYFGIERQDSAEIHGLLVIFNPVFKYLNLVSITADKHKLFSKSPELDAVLHANIPSDNVKNLYAVMPTPKRKMIDSLKLN